MRNARIDQILGRAVSCNEMSEVSATIREHLESESPGSTDHIASTAGVKHPILDELLSEFGELRKAYTAKAGGDNLSAKTPATDELAYLKAENARLTAENKNLTEQLASFDERVAQAAASQVVQMGIVDRPKNFTTARAAVPGDAEKLTDTQKVLKAKGLPLNTKVDLSGASSGPDETNAQE